MQKGSSYPASLPILIILHILIMVHSGGCEKRYLVVVLICNLLVASDVKHLFMCLLGHSCIFFWKNVCQILDHCWIGAFTFLLLNCKSSLYILNTSFLSKIDLQIFSLWAVFSLSWQCPLNHKSFKFRWCPSCPFYCFLCHLCHSCETMHNIRFQRFMPVFSSKSISFSTYI